MLRNAEHAKGRRGRPDDEVALVSQGQFQEIGEFAVDEREEDCVFRSRLTIWRRAVAEDEAEGVGRLMPGSASFGNVGFGGSDILQARLFEGIGQVGGCQPTAKEFAEGTPTTRGGEVVVDVRFSTGREEEHPILLYRRASLRRVSSYFCEGGVGF